MKFLFVHQNFPGQFRHVAKALAEDSAHQVVALGEARNLAARPPLHPKIKMFSYQVDRLGGAETHHYLRDFEGHVRRGQSVVRAALQLKNQGFEPDVVAAHPGWGEATFLRDVFPNARHINYFEYYYQAQGGDMDFDPEFPSNLDDLLRVRVKNSTQLLSLVACDQGLSPTAWQKSRYPAEFQSKIQVIHEGIDTKLVAPDAQAGVRIAQHVFRAGDEVVTYVARNLEPYRGYHIFMRALPKLLAARPKAQVLMVGGDDVSYGKRLPAGESYRQKYIDEVKDDVDWSRVHFLGKLPYQDYLRVLQVSAAHVYLTYPFVLSWSMLEAMSAGCLLIASATTPVQEVITPQENKQQNGLLVDFFDASTLAQQISAVLANPAKFQHLRHAARQHVVEHYDLQSHCLPQLLAFLKQGANRNS